MQPSVRDTGAAQAPGRQVVDLGVVFDNSYARLPDTFHHRQFPAPAPAPQLFAFNSGLAADLGITEDDPVALAAALGGGAVPAGAAPLAQLYAGHQFGHFTPQLGDGRALLLGEVIDRSGMRRDLQLKGSGRTPWSRNGDGRAALGPVLREYIVSEAMAAMRVPTTRSLAAVTTGEAVRRERDLPGAVLTRVAASHIRVGTFEFFAARGDTGALRRLFDHTVARHFPGVDSIEAFLGEVIEAQAQLVAQWLALGFIHGVMNTDNCQVAGETIDYGPCAFMDSFHPQRVFSSIDRQGRYAWGNQARVIVWNMGQLARSLLPLSPDQQRAVQVMQSMLEVMPARVDAIRLVRFGRKLGLAEPSEGDRPLIAQLLGIMEQQGADFTATFAGLANGSAARQFGNHADFTEWERRWQARLRGEQGVEERLVQANPMVIPRNHLVEAAIGAAVEGEPGPCNRLVAACRNPCEPPEEEALALPPKPGEVVTRTFCGT